MPVCKFYLQGKCKYGDRCYNEHPRESSNRRQQWDSGDYDEEYHEWQDHEHRRRQQYNHGYNQRLYNSPSNLQQNYREENSYRDRTYHTQSRGNQRNYVQDRYHWSKNSNSDNRFSALAEEKKPDDAIKVMISTIQTDVKTWAESKMWPYSCYAYNQCCVEGLPDISPEEMRVLALLHPSEYQNIVNEVEGTYCKVKDDLFSMNDEVKSNLISQMGISDTNPSKDLKIAALYGPGFNFKSTVQQGDSVSPAASVTIATTNASSKSTDNQTEFEHSHGASFLTTQSATSQTPPKPLSIPPSEKPLNISVFGSYQNPANKPKHDEVYTPDESLTETERKEFESDKFRIGEIPIRPPSEQYCR